MVIDICSPWIELIKTFCAFRSRGSWPVHSAGNPLFPQSLLKAIPVICIDGKMTWNITVLKRIKYNPVIPIAPEKGKHCRIIAAAPLPHSIEIECPDDAL